MMRRLILLALYLIALQVGACFAQSPGVVVGTTWNEYQTNTSTGNRITLCDDGGIYLVWAKSFSGGALPAKIYFNYVDADGNWYNPSVGSEIASGGMPQLAKIYGDSAAIIYGGLAGLHLNISSRFYTPPAHTDWEEGVLWPYIAVDRHDKIHMVVSTSANPRIICYARSTNGGSNWWPSNMYVQPIDLDAGISGVIAASPVSDKVAIAYAKQIDANSQYMNDIMYLLSQDGINWNISERFDITNYEHDNDSIAANPDIDIIFDYQDNFHIIWSASRMTVAYVYSNTHLLHYSSQNQEINEIAYIDFPRLSCDVGTWNWPICKMNLGVYHDGFNDGLFAVWTQYDTADCSAGGYANGDIWMSCIFNDDTHWRQTVNLTNSYTPNCQPGNCDSDVWPSLADKIDDSLHIFYVDDKDAGSSVQTEGSATENPVKYLAYPNRIPIGINNDRELPGKFQLAQNYPNPFNSKTVISFELKEAAKVKLDVFAITGAKVATLINNKEMAAGHHQVNWDGENYASGTYFYKLSAGEKSVTKQMALVK